MWLFRLAFAVLGLLAGSLVLAADADQGRRLAEMRCVPCHVVVSERQRREVSDAPPFAVIAKNQGCARRAGFFCYSIRIRE